MSYFQQYFPGASLHPVATPAGLGYAPGGLVANANSPGASPQQMSTVAEARTRGDALSPLGSPVFWLCSGILAAVGLNAWARS